MHGCSRTGGQRRGSDLVRLAGAAISLGAALMAAQAACGQSAGPDATFSGRDFGGVRFSGTADAAGSDLVLAARRAWLWSEETGRDGGRVDRLLLQGDVKVELGDYRFTAVQAVVWIERTRETSAGGPGRTQFAISFDRVADPGAQAGFAQAADRLLVTGSLDTGSVVMRVEATNPNRPPAGTPTEAFVLESEGRLAAHLAKLSGGKARAPRGNAAITKGIVPGASRPFEPNSELTAEGRGETRPEAAPAPERPRETAVEPIFTSGGFITFAVGVNKAAPDASPTASGMAVDPDAPRIDSGETGQEEIKLIRGGVGPGGVPEDNTLILSGGVVLQYQDVRQARNLQISAQRAVIFLPPGELEDLTRLSARDIKGIYVEGNVVATDGQYTVRGPRVYYDVAYNQALMVDAVFFAFDERIQAPIYVRAKELRQRSANQFSAEGGVKLATTSFFDPVLSMGASKVTITQRPDAESGGGKGSYVDAKNLTLRFMDLPFFWFPRYKGGMDAIPLKELRYENSSGSGSAIKTGWDMFGLFGAERPDGFNSRLLLDFYFERGVAIGNRAEWDRGRHRGDLLTYLLPDDDGTDSLSSGLKRDRDGETRGMILARDRFEIDPDWTLLLEGNYISDENFVDAFFRSIAQSERELENSAYLRFLDGNSVFTLQAKGSLNDFTPNQYLQTSLGYTVDKLPEVTYLRVDDLLGERAPGLITWNHEYRASRLGLNFIEPTARELGFNTLARSRAALGLTPDQSPGDALRAAGFEEDEVVRVDTRHELSSTQDFGFLKWTPFVVGRFTGYDSSFEQLSGETDDQHRFWYSAGSRLSTQITRVYNGVENDFFDLHRLRHIIEPNMTVWYGGSNVGQNDLPIYDERVESLATGTTVRAGVTQTWQTQRGGAGRWRNVDWLVLTTEFVLSTDDVDQEGPIGRFVDYRPEYSYLGDFANFDIAWQVTDAVALAANYVFDFDLNQPAQVSAGGTVQHTPDFSSYAEVRYINALDSTYVNGGVSYDLTRRYSITASANYDTDRNDFQNVGATLRRKMRESTLGISVSYDNIESETSFGVVIEPHLAQRAVGQSLRLQQIGR